MQITGNAPGPISASHDTTSRLSGNRATWTIQRPHGENQLSGLPNIVIYGLDNQQNNTFINRFRDMLNAEPKTGLIWLAFGAQSVREFQTGTSPTMYIT